MNRIITHILARFIGNRVEFIPLGPPKSVLP
uniref:Uncharacterized protein n=1 Tax=Rhizophora mucronata TaxID=61149 RepID=A0A2P2PRZ5_RHIMU